MSNHSAEIDNVEKIKVLMEEYKQLYEHARHDDRMVIGKESVFVPVSFGLLVYSVSRGLCTFQLFAAFIASFMIYLYHVLSCERMAFCSCARYKRIHEIEKAINEIVGSKVLCFQLDLDKYFEVVRKEGKESRKRWHLLTKPFIWTTSVAQSYGIRQIRIATCSLLFLLWVIFIILSRW